MTPSRIGKPKILGSCILFFDSRFINDDEIMMTAFNLIWYLNFHHFQFHSQHFQFVSWYRLINVCVCAYVCVCEMWSTSTVNKELIKSNWKKSIHIVRIFFLYIQHRISCKFLFFLFRLFIKYRVYFFILKFIYIYFSSFYKELSKKLFIRSHNNLSNEWLITNLNHWTDLIQTW